LVALVVLKKICDHPRLMTNKQCLSLGLEMPAGSVLLIMIKKDRTVKEVVESEKSDSDTTIALGALGPPVPKGVDKNPTKAGTTISVELLQKAPALLGTAHILRRVLESS